MACRKIFSASSRTRSFRLATRSARSMCDLAGTLALLQLARERDVGDIPHVEENPVAETVLHRNVRPRPDAVPPRRLQDAQRLRSLAHRQRVRRALGRVALPVQALVMIRVATER